MKYKEPFFIVSKKEIKRRIWDLKRRSDIVFYSHKTNPFIGKLITKMNDGIGLCLNHINSLRDLDEDTLKKSLYYVHSESKEEIEKILDKGIKKFIVDNENDLKKVISVGDVEDIYIRVKYREHTFYTGKYFVYGISWKKIEDIIKRYDLSNKYNLGLHFHKRTQNIGEWYIFEDFFDMFSENFLKKYDIRYVNIGGGIPWKYINSKPDLKYIFYNIDIFRKKLNDLNIKLVMEPGRYIAAPSVRLKVKVINKYEKTLVVNASIYNAYMDTYLLHHRLPILEESQNGKYCYTIKGNTLDSLDIFRYSACFENDIEIGDTLTFLNVGAYNFHCNFSFLSPIPYVIVDDFED